MTKLMAEVNTFTQMDQDTKDNGSKILNMALVKRLGLMVLPIKVTIDRVRSMERDNSRGQIIAFTLVTSKTTISKARASMSGVMVVYIMDSGSIIKCMDTVFSSGLMVVFTQESMLKT